MSFWTKIGAISGAGLLLAGMASADTLELKDGRVLQGRFLGGTQAIMRFEWNGEVRTFSVNDIVALTFTSNYHEQDNAPPPPPAPASPQDKVRLLRRRTLIRIRRMRIFRTHPLRLLRHRPEARHRHRLPQPLRRWRRRRLRTGTPVNLPVDQTLLIRMIDGVDSKKNNVGDVFHASLETDLTVNGILVARKGADVYGKLAYTKEAGHFSGSAELELELTSIVVDGTNYPLVSDDYTVKGKGRGGDTAKKVGGGAVLGAIIGGIAGGGAGAAIGAGAGASGGRGRAGLYARQRGQGAQRNAIGVQAASSPATINATAH